MLIKMVVGYWFSAVKASLHRPHFRCHVQRGKYLHLILLQSVDMLLDHYKLECSFTFDLPFIWSAFWACLTVKIVLTVNVKLSLFPDVQKISNYFFRISMKSRIVDINPYVNIIMLCLDRVMSGSAWKSWTLPSTSSTRWWPKRAPVSPRMCSAKSHML